MQRVEDVGEDALNSQPARHIIRNLLSWAADPTDYLNPLRLLHSPELCARGFRPRAQAARLPLCQSRAPVMFRLSPRTPGSLHPLQDVPWDMEIVDFGTTIGVGMLSKTW